MMSLLMALTLSVGGYAYEGQPKEISVLPSLAQKAVLQLPDISAEDLLIDDAKCAEATCSKLARVKGSLAARVGDVEYKTLFAYVDVNRQGELVRPLKARAIVFSEVETGTRLTVSIGDDRRTVCFGASSQSNFCSLYQVRSNY